LTGAPSYKHIIKDEKNILFGIMNDAADHKWLMTAVSNKSGIGSMTIGIKNDHAYSILAATCVEDTSGFLAKIVKLRDPNGKMNWTGDWSIDSSKWIPSCQEQMKVKEDKGTGCFWLSYEDFANLF